MFIQIVETDDAFDWTPLDDETGKPYQSTFQLRVVSDDADQDLRRRHTRAVLDKRQRKMVQTLDEAAYIADLLDYAIVGWAAVRSATTGLDLACSAPMKARLPERWKAEILRLCAGKEAGDVVAQREQEKKVSKST